jgi:NADH dehydrogenase [ubiquinone] 1 alpha subcomplex assembly factor 6
MTATDYLAEQVKRDDRDRYLTALFAPPDVRDSLMALYAFNAEVAKIRESVSELLIGRMKLQWWRDVIAAIYGDGMVPQGNPLVAALERAVRTHGLSRSHFDTLLRARESDLDDEPPQSVFDLERYAEGTSVPLNLLALEILGVGDQAAKDAARHVGIAWALTGMLRAVLFHARVNRFLLPQDLMAAHNLTGHDLHERRNAAKIAAVVKEIAHSAQAHLEKARGYAIDRKSLPALLSATLADGYLRGLSGRHFDVFDPRHALQRPSVIRLTWAAWRGKI